MEHGLSKKERISSLKAIEHLIARGHYVGSGPLRCCWVIRDTGAAEASKVTAAQGTPVHLNRIVVSVPKKMFRRAVKRNLLKRRIREAYRLQKQLLTGSGVDLMFVYKSKDIAPYSQISDCVAAILKQISSKLHKNEQI